jgi:hypothetical protein
MILGYVSYGPYLIEYTLTGYTIQQRVVEDLW